MYDHAGALAEFKGHFRWRNEEHGIVAHVQNFSKTACMQLFIHTLNTIRCITFVATGHFVRMLTMVPFTHTLKSCLTMTVLTLIRSTLR